MNHNPIPAVVAGMRRRARPGERVQYGWHDGEYIVTRCRSGEVVELAAVKAGEEEKDD